MDTPYNFLKDPNFIEWRLFRTHEQNKFWKAFRENNPHLEPYLKDAIEQFSSITMQDPFLSEEIKQSMHRQIVQRIRRRKTIRRLYLYSSAAAVLIMGLFVGRFLLYERTRTSLHTYEEQSIVGQELPKEEIYIISGEQKTSIADNSDIQLTGKAKAVIIDSTENKQELKLDAVAMNQLIVPYGRRSNIVLSDGTRICLNSGTRVDFPSEFKGKTREIKVEGEVFVDVVNDAKKPFIVHAGNVAIQVFGTSFNVSAYKEDQAVTVVLVEGSVAVKTEEEQAELQPGQKAEILEAAITKEDVNVSEYISWVKGVLVFEETPVLEILKKVGRYYNMQFEGSADSSLNARTCTGKLYLSSSVDSVMVSISAISSTEFQRNDNHIFISNKETAYELKPINE
ncbi:MAG: DUF4974 domain-containing protein [Bacteroidales bacterium]|nr:DUF4974 domain-containing protein [Bacteroidales bacterium]